jgi:hypothetical protein
LINAPPTGGNGWEVGLVRNSFIVSSCQITGSATQCSMNTAILAPGDALRLIVLPIGSPDPVSQMQIAYRLTLD